MKIIFDSQAFNFHDWRHALQHRLPGARLFAAGTPGAPADPDYLLLWKPERLDWSACRSLAGAIALGAGVDGLSGLQLPPGLALQRLADAGMQAAMSEYVHYGVLHFQRHFNRYLAAEPSATWTPHTYRTAGETGVGILGLGNLGSAVAGYLADRGYRVMGWAQGQKAIAGVTCLRGEAGLAQMLPRCHILVNLLPLTEQTRHLIDREKFWALPPGAGFINASRGAVTVAGDLLDALAAKVLCGALLDVFEEEPLPATHPFWQHPDIRLTPHISAPTSIAAAAEEIAGIIQAATT